MPELDRVRAELTNIYYRFRPHSDQWQTVAGLIHLLAALPGAVEAPPLEPRRQRRRHAK